MGEYRSQRPLSNVQLHGSVFYLCYSPRYVTSVLYDFVRCFCYLFCLSENRASTYTVCFVFFFIQLW